MSAEKKTGDSATVNPASNDVECGGLQIDCVTPEDNASTTTATVTDHVKGADIFAAKQAVDENGEVVQVKSVQGGICTVFVIFVLFWILAGGVQELWTDEPIVTVSRHTIADQHDIKVPAPDIVFELNSGQLIDPRYMRFEFRIRSIFEGYMNDDRPETFEDIATEPCKVKLNPNSPPYDAYCPTTHTDLEYHIRGDYGEDEYRFVEALARPCPYYIDSISASLLEQGIDPSTYCLVNETNIEEFTQLTLPVAPGDPPLPAPGWDRPIEISLWIYDHDQWDSAAWKSIYRNPILGKWIANEQFMQLVESEHKARYFFDGGNLKYLKTDTNFNREGEDSRMMWQILFYIRMSTRIQKEVVKMYSAQDLFETYGASWTALSIFGYYCTKCMVLVERKWLAK